MRLWRSVSRPLASFGLCLRLGALLSQRLTVGLPRAGVRCWLRSMARPRRHKLFLASTEQCDGYDRRFFLPAASPLVTLARNNQWPTNIESVSTCRGGHAQTHEAHYLLVHMLGGHLDNPSWGNACDHLLAQLGLCWWCIGC